MKFKFNMQKVLAALRTAGALMLGNAFVGYFFFQKTVADLWPLAVFGLGVIIAFSAETRKG
jgi:hypothetical protein